MARQYNGPTINGNNETGEATTDDEFADSDESFYSERVKILIPAMMAQANRIQSHSPEAKKAFMEVITRSGDLPGYTVFNPPSAVVPEGHRGKPVPPSVALPAALGGMKSVSF